MAFLHEKSFDPETIDIMIAAFVGACWDLGLSDPTDGAREVVARQIIELVDSQHDADELRKAVLASIRARA